MEPSPTREADDGPEARPIAELDPRGLDLRYEAADAELEREDELLGR